MAKANAPLITVSLFAVLVLISCGKKDSGPAIAGGDLVGYWSLSKYGADANDNDTLDAQESFPVLGTGFSGSMALRADGTGTSFLNVGTPVTTEFTWALVDSGKSFRTVTGTDTVYRPVEVHTSSNLTLFDTLTTPVGYWQVWKK